ncbi:MAG: hypothetical protein A3K19_21855 [Lentisphaerae bacterium RIFOXYB12_FULL_65_16]|nr:MAG: hypothetical protein A3K18_04395 [Lentisphaerae bacterium RIFOXYA12_64_32]OGV93903.1 MAG: hypothetical protein A3K19_21855 [Lentisphaerae bacterium RIFOXYB12_FULL_65_16]
MIIDINAFSGHWPFERLPNTEPVALARHLRSHGIGKALVSPIEGIFYKSPQDANEQMFGQLRRCPRLLPVAVADPTAPCWEAHLRRNVEAHRIRAAKLHPNYHGYGMAAPETQALLRVADALRLPLIVQLQMEDQRTHSPLMKVPPVDPAAVLKALPAEMTSPVILGGLMLGDLNRLAVEIAKRPNVYVELSWLEVMDCMATVLKAIDASRLLFATHLPFFFAECALAKIREGRLPRKVETAILAGNARRVFELD